MHDACCVRAAPRRTFQSGNEVADRATIDPEDVVDGRRFDDRSLHPCLDRERAFGIHRAASKQALAQTLEGGLDMSSRYLGAIRRAHRDRLEEAIEMRRESLGVFFRELRKLSSEPAEGTGGAER